MIRTLLATTAVAAVLALPVIAQDASSSVESSAMDPSMSMESSAMDSSMMSSQEAPADSSVVSTETSTEVSTEVSTESSAMADTSSAEVVTDAPSVEATGPFDIVTGYTQIDSDRFATRIIGAPVYDSGAADANHLGDINDLVVNEDGSVAAVIIGVGGFLGIGEKQVAVAYQALEWVVAEDQSERFVVQTTVDELTAAPEFVVVEDNPADGTSAPATTSEPVEGGDAMAPAPAEGGDAMAPAPAEGGDAMAPSSAAQ
jgi:hypothetical protein